METNEPLIPLTPAAFYILLALSGGEKHGYEIMKQEKHDSQGQVKMSTGTLYGSLKCMLADGLIVEAGDRPDPALDDERRRHAEVVAIAQRRRLLPGLSLEGGGR